MLRPLASSKKAGSYKKWEPEAILKTSLIHLTAPARYSGHENASPNSPSHASKVTATAVIRAQTEGQAAIDAKSKEKQFAFWITNMMHDETKLPMFHLETKSMRKSSVLACHSQITFNEASGHEAQDLDVIHPPRLLRQYTAAVLWSLLANGADSSGLRPCDDTIPCAKFVGFLSATDEHSVNVLLNKFAVTQLLDK